MTEIRREGEDTYERVTRELPWGVSEATRITAARLGSGHVDAGDFIAAQQDLNIVRSSQRARGGEEGFLARMRSFGRSR